MLKMDTDFVLYTGEPMPAVGLGTWRSPQALAGQAVEHALARCGYRHIDCAAIYRNEKEIGQAFESVFGSGVRKREDVFITSKLWNTEHKKDRVRTACEQTLADLRLECLDLYLLHWGVAIPPNDAASGNPFGRWTEQLNSDGILVTEAVPIRETWEEMEKLVDAGLVKAIGVANFTVPMLMDLMSYARIKPAVNQVELHPYLQQRRLVEFCTRNDIVVTAYSPLGSPGNFKAKGFPVLLEDEAIREIAGNHGKLPAHILIRWGIQRGTVVIPKSVTPERIKENVEALDFSLTDTEMKAIESLDRNLRFVDPYQWWKIPYFG